MKRRNVIKGLAILPLAGLARPLESVLAASGPVKKERLLIDTHIETWNFDPRFPFNHPENPNLKVAIEAPIENQVGQMTDLNLRYGVLVNPRYCGWDNSYMANCLKTYPNKFVAHGLLNPEDP